MRVVIVNSFFPPWRGGAETYVYNLAKNLQSRGHEITVVCGDQPLETGTREVDGLTVKRLHITRKIYGTPIMPYLFLRLLSEPADIMHANFPSPYIAFITAFVSKLRRVPAVLTWHNDLPPVTRTAGLLVALHDHLVLPVYLKWFRKIIATSEAYAHTSRNLERVQPQVEVIRNGVDINRFNPNVNGERIRQKLKLDECKIVLFVGALTEWHRYKGLDVLLEALSLLNDTSHVQLLVVGDGMLKSHYQEMASALSISSRVIFAGDASDSDLPEYYACSDVLVLPSKDRSEGFGLTLLEANATGKPVIGSHVGGIPGVIRDGYNGLLVPPNDPRALASKLSELLDKDDQRLIEMGKNGRKLAETLDWSHVAISIEKVYESVLSA
jgi:glycosyltransferase involved in cell wall biosynthesis